MGQSGLAEHHSDSVHSGAGVGSARPRMTADPEVEPKGTRRRFPASFKLALLEEVERHPGNVGAILRREGLYSSSLATWRKQRRSGTLKALATKRGKPGKSASAIEVEKLRRENARLTRELAKAEVIIAAQKKLAEILGVDLPKIAANSKEEE